MASYAHVLNLDTVGGVEELFVHYLTNAKSLTHDMQHVLVTSNTPHKFFKPYLRSANSVSLEKYIGPIKAPGFIRTYKRKRALSKISADATILWNRMESYKWPGHVIYYEHGASWIAKKSPESSSFFSNLDAIIANSYAAKRVLELKWEVKQPVVVIENPLKPTIQPAMFAKKHPKTLRIGYIGRLIPLKGVSILLHALKLLQNSQVSLTVAGDGPEKESLMQLAKELGLPVTFYGVVKDVSSFYDSIDLLVVPSIREPLGLVAQEAALRGCPVIAANVDGLPEVVRDTVTGFCLDPTLDVRHYQTLGGKLHGLPDLVYDPREDKLLPPKLLNPQDIAQAIMNLLSDSKLYESMSQNAIAFALQRPNFLEYTQNLLNFFKQTALQSNHRSA